VNELMAVFFDQMIELSILFVVAVDKVDFAQEMAAFLVEILPERLFI
jgi:hypothetical protein